MGTGIVTRSGADPLEVWNNRIDNFDSADLSAALRTLLGGGQLISKDGVLEISAAPAGAANRHTISVRIPDAPYVADLVVTALPADECSDPDYRSSSPSPDSWMNASARGRRVSWELFNCRVHTLTSRTN